MNIYVNIKYQNLYKRFKKAIELLLKYSKLIEITSERDWIDEQQRSLGPKQSLFNSRSVDKLSKRTERSDLLSFNVESSRNSTVASPVKNFVSSFFKSENNEIQEIKIRSPRLQPASSFYESTR
jgi:hypothetical protein